MILESRRYVVLAGYRRRSLLPAPCDAYLICYKAHIILRSTNPYTQLVSLRGFVTFFAAPAAPDTGAPLPQPEVEVHNKQKSVLSTEL